LCSSFCFNRRSSISEDGTRIAINRDTTTKTPYVKLSVPSAREVRVIVPSSDPRAGRAAAQAKLETDKKLEVTWAGDGDRYLYGKDGRIYAGSLSGGEKGERLIAGVAPDTSKKEPPAGEVPDSVKERKAKEKKELEARWQNYSDRREK